MHRKIISYENGFVRAKNDEKYEFVIKKVENGRWNPKVKNKWMPMTNSFGPKIKWVPRSLLFQVLEKTKEEKEHGTMRH